MMVEMLAGFFISLRLLLQNFLLFFRFEPTKWGRDTPNQRRWPVRGDTNAPSCGELVTCNKEDPRHASALPLSLLLLSKTQRYVF